MVEVRHHAAIRFTGTAAERGAVVTALLPPGTEFIESDTNNIWQWDGVAWKRLDGAGGGTVIGAGALPQVAYWTAGNTIAGDAGFTYNAATDTITLAGGITLTGGAASVLTVNDNVANALTVVDAGALEYLRIISDNVQPIVRFNAGGADIDHYVEAVGVADALFIRGADGQVTLGVLGAGVVQSTAGGVLSSDYTIDSTLAMASGQDFDPIDASGQDLGDATHRWDLYTQEVIFGGASGANVITVPDNVADALHVVDVGGADDYLTIVSTNAQRELVINEDGADIDTRIEAVGQANALFVRGSDGNIGIGTPLPLGALHLVRTWLGGTIRLSNSEAADTNAYGVIANSQFDKAESEGFVLLATLGVAANNLVYIGGGFAELNTATQIRFYTAANVTTRTGTQRVLIDTAGDVIIGIGAIGAQLHIDQPSATGAQPVLLLDQADEDVVLMKVIATAAAASADRTLVADADYGTPGALVGWIQIEIEDIGNRIPDQDYYLPFYAVPT